MFKLVDDLVLALELLVEFLLGDENLGQVVADVVLELGIGLPEDPTQGFPHRFLGKLERPMDDSGEDVGVDVVLSEDRRCVPRDAKLLGEFGFVGVQEVIIEDVETFVEHDEEYDASFHDELDVDLLARFRRSGHQMFTGDRPEYSVFETRRVGVKNPPMFQLC